jgi:patatin-like phospholipase/acyl hydrolase
MTAKFNILSLSGGGYLGLYTITVLAALEHEVGHPIARNFDLIAGTSVGGLIALGLAAEVPAQEIKALMEQKGSQIFSGRAAATSSTGQAIDFLRSFFSSKYRSQGLHDAVKSILKELTLDDLEHRLIIPAVNLTKGSPQLFKTPHHPSFRTDKYLHAADVAMATSAAPTYFPIAEVGNSIFADGGLFANSPDLLALHEAEHFLGWPANDVRVLSIGTTTANFSFAHAIGTELGIFGWFRGQRLTSVMLASQQKVVEYMMMHKLGDRYLRIDSVQSKEQERHLALDVATQKAQMTIKGLADEKFKELIGAGVLAPYIDHKAIPFMK